MGLWIRWVSRKTYRIRPNYHTYPYKRTGKQFHRLQITASALFSNIFLQRHTLWVPIWVQHMLFKTKSENKSHKHHQISPFAELFLNCPLSRHIYILYHKIS